MVFPKALIADLILDVVKEQNEKNVAKLVDIIVENLNEIEQYNLRTVENSTKIDKQHEETMHVIELMKQGFESVDKRFDDVNKRFDDVNKRFESVDKRFEELIHYMDKRFESVDKRFESVDKRFEELIHHMDKRFETVDKRFEDMNNKFKLLTWIIGIGFGASNIFLVVLLKIFTH